GEAATTWGRCPGTRRVATIKALPYTRRNRSLTMLKWTLRATAVLAVAAAIAAPVAVPAPEATPTAPSAAVTAAAPEAGLASPASGTTEWGHPVAL
ncbi:hypothetical protein, partial [Streptomyces erythrochromogenes]|uniref:hypothetical protein n=1 Tax=Streptomyces erythrochromogenes TaxID=285574 RepID=UPI0036CA9B4B